MALIIFSVLSAAQDPVATGLRNFLMTFDYNDRQSLAQGFRLADKDQKELVSLLNDANEKVQLNAQILVRYIAEVSALSALHNSKSGQTFFSGPVPVPLDEWDYQQIEKSILCDSCSLKGPIVNYVYALVLDGSPRSHQFLELINTKFSPKFIDARQPNLLSTRDLEK